MHQDHIVIIGAGVVGLATAYALLSQGHRHVTVLEQEKVDHLRATSRGSSRLLRFEYGADVFYSQMVRHSLERWLKLERVTDRTLYTRTGVLMLGSTHDHTTQPCYHILKELDLPIQRLSTECCLQHFPQFHPRGFDFIAFNYEAGILHASHCLRVLKALIQDLGGQICESCKVTEIRHENSREPISLHISSGEVMLADRIVVATGPWVHRLLGHLHLPIRLTRQHVLYFAGLPSTSYELNAFPAFLADDLYGFPIHPGPSSTGCQWLKATSHSFGTEIDPDDPPGMDLSVIQQVTQRLHTLIPALQQAELIHVETCMYDVSPDEDFVLDRDPDDPRVVFATGLTGHGFKFGLLLGDLLRDILLENPSAIPTSRFQLARFSRQDQSSISLVS